MPNPKTRFPVSPGIPIPAVNEGRPYGSKYPWDELVAGASFFVPASGFKSQRHAQIGMSSLVSRQTRATGVRYVTRRCTEPDPATGAPVAGVRVWRRAEGAE